VPNRTSCSRSMISFFSSDHVTEAVCPRTQALRTPMTAPSPSRPVAAALVPASRQAWSCTMRTTPHARPPALHRRAPTAATAAPSTVVSPAPRFAHGRCSEQPGADRRHFCAVRRRVPCTSLQPLPRLHLWMLLLNSAKSRFDFKITERCHLLSHVIFVLPVILDF
jgi:hypothetical protein